jgi:ribosomal protein S18 acetylase RimI-like enzyme
MITTTANPCELAQQAADLLNQNNQLTSKVTARHIVEHSDEYVFLIAEDRVLGCVHITRRSWYQAEISHLVVAEEARGQGLGKRLVSLALGRVQELGLMVAQCTIREDNQASLTTFKHAGFKETVSFTNPESGNVVIVLQISLSK